MSCLFSFRKWFDRLRAPAEFCRWKPAGALTGVPTARQRIRLRLEELEDRLAPATTLSIADASALEPTPGATANMDFTITRTGDLTTPLTVAYTAIPGTAPPT